MASYPNRCLIKKSCLFFLNLTLFFFSAFHVFADAPSRHLTDTSALSYKEWSYGPDTVFGIAPLLKIKNRSYVKIARINNQLYKISKFNPAGLLINTTQVKLKNGLLSLITETNQWGENYDSTWFIASGPYEFLSIHRKRGLNE